MLCVLDCARPLGLEYNKNQIRSPASLTDLAYPPDAARLNGPSAWCPIRTLAYLQIDLDRTYKLTAIATQGGGTVRNKWVQGYTISFKAGNYIVNYIESGSRKVRSALLLYFHCCRYLSIRQLVVYFIRHMSQSTNSLPKCRFPLSLLHLY